MHGMQEVVGSTPIFSTKNRTSSPVFPLIRCPLIILFIVIHKYPTLQFQGFYRFPGLNMYSYFFLITLPNYRCLMKALVCSVFISRDHIKGNSKSTNVLNVQFKPLRRFVHLSQIKINIARGKEPVIKKPS